jgi:hypothetical protein
MPLLPKPGSELSYFVLSLTCVRGNDLNVFSALLEAVIQEKQSRHSFFLAGLHERDPLVAELLARAHFPLMSRLYAVAWEDHAKTVQELSRKLALYLELGSL